MRVEVAGRGFIVPFAIIRDCLSSVVEKARLSIASGKRRRSNVVSIKTSRRDYGIFL